MRSTKFLLDNYVIQNEFSSLTLSGTTNIIGNFNINSGASLQIDGGSTPYLDDTTFNTYTGETQSILSEITIVGGLTQSPSTTLNLSGISMVTITLTGNTVVTGITNVSLGSCLIRYIHSGYTLTVSGKTNFKNYSGSYYVRISNVGTTSSPIILITDVISTNESDVTTLIGNYDIVSELDSDLGSTDWRIGGGTGSSSTFSTTPYNINTPDVKKLFTTPIQLKASPGTGITDNVTECWSYVDYKGFAYTGNTTLALKSGNSLLGTSNCLTATTSGWHKFTLTGISETNAALTVTALSGNPTGGTSNVGVVSFYNQLNRETFNFHLVPIMEDDFSGTTINTSKWTVVNPNTDKTVISQNNGIIGTAIGTTASTSTQDYIRSIREVSGASTLMVDFTSNSPIDQRGQALRLVGNISANTRIAFSPDSAGVMFCYITINGSNQITPIDTGVQAWGNRWAFTVNASNRIRFWRWVTNAWVEIDAGTSKTYNIGTVRYASINLWNAGVAGTAQLNNFKYYDSDILTP